MFSNLKSKLYNNPIIADLLSVLFFGLLSLIFGELNFVIPGLEGGMQSDFREIPLLVSIFYIRNPLFLILISVITSFYSSIGIPVSLNIGLHTVSLFGIWVAYFYIKKHIESYSIRIITWVLSVAGYFYLLIIPSYILIGSIIGYLSNISFIDVYSEFYETLLIEVIASTLVTGLYLTQLEIRESLEKHKINLEFVVGERTKELALANKTLTYLNENLDDMVKHRSKKVEDQLALLVKYAHMNSHEVRAPLARMLGLVYIISNEKDEVEKASLLKKIGFSAKELDEVIRKMNRLLEKEIFSRKRIV